ncbi:hypothetical protein ACFQ9X_23080 [Catenulispora yoronensis]
MALLLVVVSLFVPGIAVQARFAGAVWAVAAITFGVRVHLPPRRSVWLLIALSVAAFQCADFGDLHHRTLAPMWTDWLAFLGYPLAAVALSAMIRLRSGGGTPPGCSTPPSPPPRCWCRSGSFWSSPSSGVPIRGRPLGWRRSCRRSAMCCCWAC